MHYLLKNTLFIYFVFLLNFSCLDIKKQEANTIEIEYKAMTRGRSISIVYKSETINFKSNTEKKSILLKENEMNRIKNTVLKINLTEIENLNAPSNLRFTDGALIANFKIIKNNKEYLSSEFDHNNPPKELEQIFELLIEYSKLKKVEK